MSSTVLICNCKREVCTSKCMCKSFSCFTKRYTTFTNFPKDSFMNPYDLAMSGFTYRQIYDICYCYFCKLEVDKWTYKDCPYREHDRLSPYCPYLRKMFKKMNEVETKNTSKSFDTVDNTANLPKLPILIKKL